MKITLLILIISFCFSLPIMAQMSGHVSGENIKYDKSLKRQKLSKEDKQDILKVFKANELLHAGFFKYKRSKIMSKVAPVQLALKEVRSKNMKKMFSKSSRWLNEISTKLKKKQNYKKYNMFSEELIKLLIKYDIGSGYDIYACPMVNMRWVQNSKVDPKVNNPYASYMPHCGSRESRF
jgi:signal recognition particle GTPase